MDTPGFYLESSSGQEQLPRRIDLRQLPATIGRAVDCTLPLESNRLSRRHARFSWQEGSLWLEDLGSTNGTYVNHSRLEAPQQLRPGDVIHFADHEFRLRKDSLMQEPDPNAWSSETQFQPEGVFVSDFPLETAALLELLEREQVTGYVQALVRPNGEVFGYELLGRSTHPDLQQGPGQMFALAASLGKDVELSRLLRRRSFAQASAAGIRAPLFFNNHPAECRDMDALLAEITRLRQLHPELTLVFEVPEAAVTDLAVMARVKRSMRALDVGLAYDDFGAGQARLLELAEVPPDYLKFDMGLVQGLSSRDSGKYQLLAALTKLVHGFGIATLAEGIETREQADFCTELGIGLLQGFLFNRPQPIAPV